MPGGLYLLTAHRDGFATANRTVQLPGAGTREENFTLSIGVVATQVIVSAEYMTPRNVAEVAQFVSSAQP